VPSECSLLQVEVVEVQPEGQEPQDLARLLTLKTTSTPT
jgi:hypothetical protein